MLKRIRWVTSLFAVALVLAAHPTAAQKTGPNGGLLAGKDGHETELIVSPSQLTVYLIEDGKTQATKGINIRAVIQEGSKSTTVGFTPANGTKLVAKLAAPLSKGAIVVISGKDDHGHSITARYVID